MNSTAWCHIPEGHYMYLFLCSKNHEVLFLYILFTLNALMDKTLRLLSVQSVKTEGPYQRFHWMEYKLAILCTTLLGL